jgi:hypothetical protein
MNVNSLTRAAVAALALLGSAAAAEPAKPRRVAVLDFVASWTRECAAGAPADDAAREQCEILRLLADKARVGALAVLRPPAYVVMTRENTAQLLKELGGQCAEGECEVETARLLGASVVVSGEVTWVEGNWVVSIRVHDVESSALLGGADARGTTKLQALDAVRAETERMLTAALGTGASVASAAKAKPANGREPRPRRWYAELRFGEFWHGDFPASSGLAPCEGGRCSGLGGGILAGRRLTDEWAVEAAARLDQSSYNNPTGNMPYNFSASALTAGGAWNPLGNRWFGVAAHLGAVGTNANSGGAELNADNGAFNPIAAAEVRLDARFRSLQLGLRAGITAVYLRTELAVTRDIGTPPALYTEAAPAGWLVMPGVSVAARFWL